MEEFNDFRSKCGLLWSYDWISIPLVYTQVVTLATYAFFGACIFGRQYVESPDRPDQNFELYIPIFTIFQLFFYMGLLKDVDIVELMEDKELDMDDLVSMVTETNVCGGI
ncbi:bestrophin-2 [Caerostris extrusa]|uniref:Bestrophin homolog n=1 Tax=Caerostris extrusa TaxID=172846 RepID=A0AAV4P4E9_CAEEX|nr:bestrophin-2 [Caerostris extrusa]